MYNRKVKELLQEIIDNIDREKLSALFNKALTLSRFIKSDSLKQWCEVEINGYPSWPFGVPSYRKIPVTFFDHKGEKIDKLYGLKTKVYTLKTLDEQHLYPFRGPLIEFEDLTIKRGVRTIIHLKEKYSVKINRTQVKAESFEYVDNQILPLYETLRQQFIDTIMPLVDQHDFIGSGIIKSLHPEVIKTASALITDGHYRQAVLDTFINLVNKVKAISGLTDLDNTPLMQRAFSASNPVIKLSNDLDEQRGYMWLFSGAVMSIRNPKAHNLDHIDTFDQTIEWLYFASTLFRLLDKREIKINHE